MSMSLPELPEPLWLPVLAPERLVSLSRGRYIILSLLWVSTSTLLVFVTTSGPVELIHVADFPGDVGIDVQRLLLDGQILTRWKIRCQQSDVEFPDLINDRHLEVKPG